MVYGEWLIGRLSLVSRLNKPEFVDCARRYEVLNKGIGLVRRCIDLICREEELKTYLPKCAGT